jgi:hypothetical protein
MCFPSDSSTSTGPDSLLHDAGGGAAPGGAPGGTPTSGVAVCCPDMAEFRKHTDRQKYYGFDDKTDLVAAPADAYITPPTKAKTAPTDRLTRDGAIWLSVEKGQQTTTKIHFDGAVTCITNCTFEVTPASIASVITSTIAANGVDFTIQGDASGDCTVVVKCQGKDLGWVHVACRELVTFNVGICHVNQDVPAPPAPAPPAGTPAPPPVPPTLALPRPTSTMALFQELFDDAYRDAAVKVVLTSLPEHKIPTTTNLMNGNFFNAANTMTLTQFIAKETQIYAIMDAVHATVSAANPTQTYILYLMRPPVETGRNLNGFARNIPSNYGLFFNDDNGVYSTAAHEFGHCIGLRHTDDALGASQYVPHLVVQKPGPQSNVSLNDELNLMGYGSPRPQRRRLRYKQWDKLAGR